MSREGDGTRMMRFTVGESAAQVAMLALLEDPDALAPRTIVYWVVRPLESRLSLRPSKTPSIVSFFRARHGELQNLDWQIRDFTQSFPVPMLSLRGGTLQVHASADKGYGGLVCPRSFHPVEVVRHISRVLWNDSSYLGHQQL